MLVQTWVAAFVFLFCFSCKQRVENSSEAKTQFAFSEKEGEVNFLNAHQLTYLSDIAYEPESKVTTFSKEFELSLDKVEDVNGTFYFIVSSPTYIILAFRGTEKSVEDLRTDFKIFHRKFITGSAHCGFCEAYSHVKVQVRKTIADLYFQKPRQIYLTGHSLGGALANIAALDLTNYMEELSERYPTAPFNQFKVTGLYTFGAPRVFDANGAKYMDEVVTQHFRFMYGNDLVVKIPFELQGFSHSGNGFYFKRDNCEIITDKKLTKSWTETLFGPLQRFVGLFKKYSFMDHGLANYRRCFVEGKWS